MLRRVLLLAMVSVLMLIAVPADGHIIEAAYDISKQVSTASGTNASTTVSEAVYGSSAADEIAVIPCPDYVPSHIKEAYYSYMKKSMEVSSDCLSASASNREDSPYSTVVMSFAGDCTIGTDEAFGYTNSFPDVFERHNYDYSYFFSGVSNVFRQDDLTLVNLETTFTEATAKAEKKFRFRGKPDYVNILKAGSIEMVNVVNNHIYDYLKKGFDDTLAALDAAGVYHSGLGHTAYYNTKGLTIASIGYKIWDNPTARTLQSDIQEARKNANLVVVSFHWGVERSYYPNQTQLKLGRLAVDYGADIVIGHHPHVIQGIELYKGRYIVYSLGNFCFGGNKNPADKDTMIFQSEFMLRDNKLISCTGKIIPCQISSVDYVNDYKPVILEGKKGQKVLDRIYKYSQALDYGIKPMDK